MGIVVTVDAAPPPRNRWFVDSPLEGDGFELPVPRAMQARLEAKIAGVGCVRRRLSAAAVFDGTVNLSGRVIRMQTSDSGHWVYCEPILQISAQT